MGDIGLGWIGSNQNGANDIYPGSQRTYAEVIAAGIQNNWSSFSASFSVYGQNVKLSTKVHSRNPSPNNIFDSGSFDSRQRFTNVRIVKGLVAGTTSVPLGSLPIRVPIPIPNERVSGMASHVDFNVKNMGWNGLKSVIIDSPVPSIVNKVTNIKREQLINCEKDLFDWSIRNASSFTLYDTYSNGVLVSAQDFGDTAAHEFGHVLGLGDAYNAGYRGGSSMTIQDGFYAPEYYTVEDRYGNPYNVRVPNDDIMIGGNDVTSNDVRMVLDAWTQGEVQYFPWGTKYPNQRFNAGIYYWTK